MNNKEHAKNLLDTMPIVNRAASIMNAGARSRFNSPTEMGHSPTEMGHSPAEMGHSPLEAKNFPVKPGMKLADFEEVLDKQTGKIVDKSVLNAPEGTDLSRYEGITNITKLTGGVQGKGNISNRIAGTSGRQRTFEGYQFPEVNTNVNKGVTKNESDEVDGFTYSSQSNKNLTNKAVKQLMSKVAQRNYLSDDYEKSQYQNLKGEFVGPKDRISESDAKRTTTPSGESIYTTARVTGQTDNVSIPDVSKAQGSVRATPGRNTSSNLTQSNKNFPQAFTPSEIESRITAKPGRFYSTQGDMSSKIGNIGIGENRADRYDHLDFTGTQQAPNISSSTSTRSGNIIKSQESNEARRRGIRKDQVRSLFGGRF
jgi:hypothetical protein|tara:strand:+ start:2128 stop:3234 length:1107 start_codon:yes stop_codon:yes gene_type:complete